MGSKKYVASDKQILDDQVYFWIIHLNVERELYPIQTHTKSCSYSI